MSARWRPANGSYWCKLAESGLAGYRSGTWDSCRSEIISDALTRGPLRLDESARVHQPEDRDEGDCREPERDLGQRPEA